MVHLGRVLVRDIYEPKRSGNVTPLAAFSEVDESFLNAIIFLWHSVISEMLGEHEPRAEQDDPNQQYHSQ